MTQTITTQRKTKNGVRALFWPLLCAMFFLSFQAMGQSKVTWQANTPEQSSDFTVFGPDGYLDFNILVADADIPNAVITLSLPAGVDYVGLTNQAGMTATVGAVGKTGSLSAGWILKLPITSNANTLKINDVVSIRIGMKATCSINMSSPGQFSVVVSGSSGTITNATKSIPMSVRKPSVRMNPIGGNGRNYATIGSSQNFKLGLSATNGTATSVLVKLTYEGNVVTLSNFKIGALAIPVANISSTGTTTKTTTLTLTLAELGSPIDAIAKEISFDAVANLGCDRVIKTQLQFDAVTNCETVDCEQLVMKLPSETAVANFSIACHMQMARDMDATGTTEKRNDWSYFCFDGNTPGYGHLTLSNTNNAPAASLGFNVWVNYGAWSTQCSYIDTTDVYCRINGGTEIKIPGNCITNMTEYPTSDPSILAFLKAKPYKIAIKLPDNVNIPAGAVVEVRYAFYVNPAWRDSNIRKSQQYYQASFNGIDIGYGEGVYATNICGVKWSRVNSSNYCSSFALPRFYYVPVAQNLKPNKSGVLSNYFYLGNGNSATGTNGTGQRATDVFVKLPSWMSLNYSSDITEAFDISGSVPVVGSGQSLGGNTYSVRFVGSTLGDLNIKYKTGPCGAMTGLQSDTVRIWADFISGTPTIACRPKFECQTQLFQPVALNCSDKGMMMDTLYMYRQTRGLKDSNSDHYPDNGTKALDSEINHDYYVEGDTGYFCIKGYIKGAGGDTFKKLYTRLKLTPGSNGVQYKFGTSGNICPIWDKAVINIKKQGNNPAVSYPLTIPVVNSVDSIYALYDGDANTYLLQPEDSVELRIPFVGLKGNSYHANINELVTVESYAMNTTPVNPFMPVISERFGFDFLAHQFAFAKNYVLNISGTLSYYISSLTTPVTVRLANNDNYPNYDFPKEVRYFHKPQTSEVRIPYGYVIADGKIYVRPVKWVTDVFDTAIPLTPVSRREDTVTGDSIYVVDLSTIYDYNYDGSSPVASGKVFLGDDQQGIYSYANLLPTPGLSPGVKTTATGNISSLHYKDGTVVSAGSSDLYYTGPSLNTMMSPTSLTVNSEGLSIASYKLINNGGVTAKNTWIYVDGNARNAALIATPTDTIFGEGLDGRWINVGDIAAGNQKEYKLNFIYTGGTSCDGDTIRIYTVVDFLNTNYNPNTNKTFAEVKSEYRGQRQILTLNNSASKSKISGLVTTNATLLAFNVDYEVNAMIDGRGSQGALNDPRVAITAMEGQLYKAGSATIEYPVGTIIPVSAAFEQLLVDELGNTGTLANARTFNARLADALGRTSIMLPGWGADVSLGYTDIDRMATLHLKFTPKCETPLTGIRFKGVFTGKSACGQDVIDNGLISITNPSIYTNITSDYDFKVTINNSNILERAFSPEKTTDVITAIFTKNTGVNTKPVVITDSIQLVLPKYLNINGAVTCTVFPGVTIGSNKVNGDTRTISLSLPASQLNALMATSAAGTPFSYQIPVVYTPDDQALAIAPLQNIVAQVVTNLRFDPSCAPKLATIGTANMDLFFVTFTQDPYIACLNTAKTLEVTSAATNCKWYKEAAKTNLLSSAITYDYTPTTQASAIFYLEATYNSVVYGTVPITVNMNPEPTITVASSILMCIGSDVDLTTKVSNTPAGSTVKYYTANDGTGELIGTDLTVTPSIATTYYVQVTTTEGCKSAMEAITVTPTLLPEFNLTSATANTCSGAAFDLSTLLLGTVSNGGVLKYYSDAACTTSISNSVTTSGTYYLRAENTTSGCKSPVQSVTVTLKTPTAITTQPTGGSTCAGTNISMSVVATGEGTLTYQWKRGATNIASATSSTYATDVAGSYTVDVTGECGTETSSAAVIVAKTPTAISAQPVATTSVCVGSPVSLSVTASGEGTLTYQWYDTGGAISGATNSTYAPTTNGTYHVIVTGECGTVTSNNALVTINPLPVPTITGASTASNGQSGVVYTTETGMSSYSWTISGGTINSGQGTASISVTWGTGASGTLTVTYLSNGCSPIAPTSKSITLGSQSVPIISLGSGSVCPNEVAAYSTESGKFNYNWTITGGTIQSGQGTENVSVIWDGSGASSVKVEYRHANNSGLPLVDATESITRKVATVITTSPVGNTLCSGGSHAMNVVAGCQGTPTYTWKKDGVTCGTNNSSYTAVATGNYTVEVLGACGTATSAPATVTVKSVPTATLSGQQTVVATQSEVYTAGAGSNYTWTVTGGTVTAGGTATDATATVTWGSTTPGEVKVSYEVSGCPTTEEALSVTIGAQGTPVINNPVTTICLNNTQTYSTETGKYDYLWTVVGGTVTNGTTATATVTWGAAGTGTIKVAYKSAPTATAIESVVTNVTINDIPTIATLAAPAGICDGTALNLTSPVVTATPAASAQGWKLNSVAFTSGSTVAFAQNTHPLVYEATNTCGTAISNSVAITVYALPTVTTTAQLICPATSINLLSTVTNPSGYALSFYTAATGGTALTSSTVTPATTTTYYVESKNANNCTSATRTPVTITLKTVTAITAQPVAPSIVGIGNPFTLSVTAVGENLTYQWYKDNIIIPGALFSNYTVGVATLADYGQYHVVVTGDCGTAQTSSSVTVDILSSDATLKDLLVNGVSVPDFDPQITDYTYYSDCNVELADIVGIKNYPNATLTPAAGWLNQTLVIGDNRYTFTVVAENGFTTKTYSINVVRDCYVPKILKDIEDAVICVGDTHTFEIEVEGQGLTYEWYYGLNRIQGANTNTYTVHTAELRDYERYQVVIRSNFNGFKSSAYSKKVRLWVADYLPATLKFSEYPNPATTGQTYYVKVDGYIDVTKYTWSYDKEGVSFSPGANIKWTNEAWATFGTLSAGTGTLKVTMEHPCGTRELTKAITVKYPTGVDDVTATMVQVYPNPTSGIVKVSNTEANQMIRITDVTGSTKGTYKTQEGTTTIDLIGYAKGTYMVQYNGKTYKVIKK